MDYAIEIIYILVTYLIRIAVKILPIIVLYLLYIFAKVYALSRLSYNRYFDTDGEFEGDDVILVEEITNNLFFPLFFVDVQSYINDLIRMYGLSEDNDATDRQMFVSRFTLMPFTSIKRKHKVFCRRRGKCLLETAEIVYFKKVFVLDSEAVIYIYPRQLSVETVNRIQCRQHMQDSSKLPLFINPFEFVGVREYKYGDPFNRINFKAMARLGNKLCVNQYEYIIGRRQMVYLDFGLPSGYTVKEYSEYIEIGLSYCSYLLDKAMNSGFEIGFAANCKMYSQNDFIRYPLQKVLNIEYYKEILQRMACARLSCGLSLSSLLRMDVSDKLSDTEIIIMTLELDKRALEVIEIMEMMGNYVSVINIAV